MKTWSIGTNERRFESAFNHSGETTRKKERPQPIRAKNFRFDNQRAMDKKTFPFES